MTEGTDCLADLPAESIIPIELTPLLQLLGTELNQWVVEGFAVLGGDIEKGTAEFRAEQEPEPTPLEPAILGAVGRQSGDVVSQSRRCPSGLRNGECPVSEGGAVLLARKLLAAFEPHFRHNFIVELSPEQRDTENDRSPLAICDPFKQEGEVHLRSEIGLVEMFGKSRERLRVLRLDSARRMLDDPTPIGEPRFCVVLPLQGNPERIGLLLASHRHHVSSRFCEHAKHLIMLFQRRKHKSFPRISRT